MNWRPIETAPKDGTVILTDEGTAIWIDPEDWSCPMTKGWQLCTGGGTLVDEDGEGLMLSPLWWMPIPPIPTPGVFYVIHGRDAVRLAERDALSIYHKGKQTTLGDALQLVKGEPALLNVKVVPIGWWTGKQRVSFLPGYSVSAYFTSSGCYLGPDDVGIEPTWADA